MKKIKGTLILEMYILLMFAVTTVNTPIAHANPALNLAVETNKQSYYLREKVNIHGNLTEDGAPVQGELMALEVDDVYGPIIFRTLQTGTTPTTGDFEIVSIIPCKEMGPFTWFPTDTFEVGSEAWFNVTVKNVGTLTKSATITLSIYEGNNIPIGTGAESYQFVLPNSSTWSLRSITIPTWAYIGTATAYASVFTDLPPEGGVPYCSEKSATFNIVRVGSGDGTGLGMKLNTNPAVFESTQTNDNGSYSSTFRLSPEPWPGVYEAYLSSRHEIMKATNSTTFQVLDAHSPPQASFTYSPPSPVWENQTVEFDASGSTAEGYGDYIVRYKWDFGDDTPPVTETDPITYHAFITEDVYIVTLNVTDNEGLWCTTSKPITILEQWGPTANFTHSPTSPYEGKTTVFNASLTQPGVPYSIANYTWDFGDNTPLVTETDPIISHIFTKDGVYTVNLTVTDTGGLVGIASKPITVLQPLSPTAKFTYSPPNPYVNRTTIFNASLTQPGWPYPIANYTWDFGDNSSLITKTGPVTTHIYRKEGIYIVTLNVTDTWGLWNTTSQTLNVTIQTEFHDVAVINVTLSDDHAYNTWTPPIKVFVTVKNFGSYYENFTVIAYYSNATGNYTIGTKGVYNLAPEANTTLTFNWYLSQVKPSAPDAYTIFAEALLPGDANPENDVFVDATVMVKKPGDMDGNGSVGLDDLIDFGKAWVGPYDPEADFDHDGDVDLDDLIDFGKGWVSG